MGGEAAVVERENWNVRIVVPRSGAMAGSGRGSSTFACNGSGDDVFDSAEFLLCRRYLGYVLARLDLGQHCLRYKSEEESPWAENAQSGVGGVEGAGAENARYAAVARCQGTERCRTLLLRLAQPSPGGSLVGLVRIAQQVLACARGCSELLRVV